MGVKKNFYLWQIKTAELLTSWKKLTWTWKKNCSIDITLNTIQKENEVFLRKVSDSSSSTKDLWIFKWTHYRPLCDEKSIKCCYLQPLLQHLRIEVRFLSYIIVLDLLDISLNSRPYIVWLKKILILEIDLSLNNIKLFALYNTEVTSNI